MLRMITIVFALLYPMFAQIGNETQQIILVVSDTWEASTADLYLLEKKENEWRYQDLWPVVIGRNGLAWGKGEFTLPTKDSAEKKEGDGKSPAGIFKITNMLYGYAENPPKGTKLKYTMLTTNWRGVDDSKSKYYNQVIDSSKVKKKDWDSFEHMRRKDHLYRWVLVVEHNTSPVTKGAGSCIFIHLWYSPDTKTSGCTAMTEGNMLKLVKWLDPQKMPRIIQLPRRIYQGYASKIGLPNLPVEKLKIKVVPVEKSKTKGNAK